MSDNNGDWASDGQLPVVPRVDYGKTSDTGTYLPRYL